MTTAIAIMGWCSVAIAQDDPARTLFTNVHVFDGVSAERIENANVLVEGNLIKSVSTDPIDAAGATVIDGGGRTLMPGMIDLHWHTALSNISVAEFMNADMGDITIAGLLGNEQVLMENIDLVADAEANFDLIMKDGVIYKNTLN